MTVFIRISPVVLVLIAVAFVASHMGGVSVAIAAIGISVAVAVVIAVAVGSFAVVRHALREIPSMKGFTRTFPAAPPHELPGAERPAIGPPQQLHLHFHGVDANGVAEIIRQQKRPEQ